MIVHEGRSRWSPKLLAGSLRPRVQAHSAGETAVVGERLGSSPPRSLTGRSPFPRVLEAPDEASSRPVGQCGTPGSALGTAPKPRLRTAASVSARIAHARISPTLLPTSEAYAVAAPSSTARAAAAI